MRTWTRAGCLSALLVVAWGMCAPGAASAAPPAPAKPVEAVLEVLPPDVGACLVIEDLAGHYDRLKRSYTWKQLWSLPPVESWAISPDYARLLALQSVLPLYFGVTFEELRDGVFGESVVFAYRAPQGDRRAVGIVAAHVSDRILRTRLLAGLTGGGPGRQRKEHVHLDTPYIERIEPLGRRDFFVELGPVVVFTDDELAIQEIITVAKQGGGLAHQERFAAMRQALPPGCLVQLLVAPRSLDGLMGSALQAGTREAADVASALELADQTWKAIGWFAVTVRMTQNLHLGLHVAMDRTQLPTALNRLVDANAMDQDFWSRVPAEALLAGSIQVDFPNLIVLMDQLIPASRAGEAKKVESIVDQLLGEWDFRRDVLPRVGPDVGVLMMPGHHPMEPSLLFLVRLADNDDQARLADVSRKPMSDVLDSAFHALLVLLGAEISQEFNDTLRVQVDEVGTVRVHYLHGSERIPATWKPAFAVLDRAVLVGNSPTVIDTWLQTHGGATPVADGGAEALLAPVRADLPHAQPRLVIHVTGIRKMLQANAGQIIDQLAEKEQQAEAREKVGFWLSLLELLDRVLITSEETNHIHHWTLSLVPPEQPAPLGENGSNANPAQSGSN